MNLRKEMLGDSDNANNWDLTESELVYKNKDRLDLIEVKDAIKIAKQYAEQKCKEQRKADSKIGEQYEPVKYGLNIDYVSREILNSPLATDK